MIRTKYVTTVTVTDPDTRLPVDVEIRKMETGGMVGLDASFLQQMVDEDEITSPYDKEEYLLIPDDEETTDA